MEAFKIKNGLSAKRYLGSNGTETAGSEGYDLAGASYDSVSFSVAAQETGPQGVLFKPDGTKMYIVGLTGDDVNEYNLSTSWDISTASYNQNFSVSAQETLPTGIFFKPDGLKMYIIGFTGDDVNEYNLSTAWDISTASYNQNFSVASQETTPQGISFKPDGTKMYVTGQTGDDVNEYNLSTSWDISTASYSQNFSISAQDIDPTDVFFKPDGLKMYVTGNAGDAVYKYDLSTAWDISTASYSHNFSVSAQDSSPSGVFFKPDGTKMYVVATSSDTIYQYSTVAYTQTLDLSTGTTFSFTPSGATTVSFTNPPASGNAIGFSVEINGDGSAITWPSSVKWHGGAAPTRYAGKDLYTFITIDGGITYYGKLAVEAAA
jgi:DNA-binding beta-propeller fold protein YncE